MKASQTKIFMKLTILFSLLCTVCSLTVDSDKSCSSGQSCVVKDECPAVQRLYSLKGSQGVTREKKKEYLGQLKKLICNHEHRGFCCDVEPQFRCGKVDQDADFIFGGKQTQAGEFPFTALIGARKVTHKSS